MQTADESVADRVVRDHILFGQPLASVASVLGISEEDAKGIVASSEPKVKAMLKAKRAIQRNKYLSLAPLATRALKRILTMNPMVEVVVGGKPTGMFKTDPSILKVQREAAEGVLETAGAKKSKGGGGIKIGINNSPDRSRARGSIDSRPIDAILASCSLEKGEKNLITQEADHGPK